MDNQKLPIFPDGSSNRNTPERCSRPLYSQVSTQERHKILRCYQNKTFKHINNDVKEESEDIYVIDDEPCKEEEIPPEISTGATKRNSKDEEEDEKQVMTERKILEIGMDGRYRWHNMEKHPIEPPEGELVEDEITAYAAKEQDVTPNPQPAPYKAETSLSCLDCGKRFTHESYLIIHNRIHTGEKSCICPVCRKRFTYPWSLDQHIATHTADGSFPCPECGKHFRTEFNLTAHRRHHSGKDIKR